MPSECDPLDEGRQHGLLEGGDDQQDEVGAVGAGFPDLVGRHDEVLAQDGDVHLGADGVEVGERCR